MSTGRRGRKARLLFALAFATLAFSLHTADAAAQSFLSINDVTMNEGNSGTTPFTFTVTLSNPPPPPGNFTIMVDWATGGGTAMPGSCLGGADYIPTGGSLTFNRNNLTRPLTVQVCGDTVFEPNETFLVNLFNERPQPPPIIVIKRQGLGTIVNDDVAPLRPTRTDVNCAALTVGVAATCTATVTDIGSGTPTTPTGTVNWSSTAGGTFAPNPCVLSPTATVGVANCTTSYTPSSAGSAQITATYSGDATHTGSTGQTTVTVAKRPTQTDVSCDALTVGIAASCTATVTDTGSGTKTTPTGTVGWSSTAGGAFVPNPCVLTPTATVGVASCSVSYTPSSAGNATVTATYGGDLTHSGSQGSATVTVAKRPTQTEVSCEDSSFEAGGSTNCTATVTDTGAGTKTTPTGTVDWSSSESGTFVPDPCTLTPTATPGVASCTVVFSSTKAATHTITAIYGGDPIHLGSQGSTTVTVTPGPPATVSLDPLVAENQVDTQHCVTATVEDRFGNRTPGITVVFTVTGSNSTTGSRTTDGDGEAEFCYTGRLFGVDTIDAFADTDNDGTRDLGEPSAVPPAMKTWLLPPSTPLCEVEFPTGGGHFVADNGDRASFGGNAHVSSTGDPSGEQQYRDHGPVQPLTVHSISVLAVVCVRFLDGHAEATIFGEATIDGSGRYAYRIDVEDRGELGLTDTYWITLSNGYNSGRHLLEGGNITIH
jgi:Bacterial Ig-like domain (group 1)/Bacterial Ig-like domain (group 3)/Calx-beta domain